jgi:CRP/FNR family transcriptional regulator, cyclic AMP receptor protein
LSPIKTPSETRRKMTRSSAGEGAHGFAARGLAVRIAGGLAKNRSSVRVSRSLSKSTRPAGAATMRGRGNRAEAGGSPVDILRGALDAFELSSGEVLFLEGEVGDRMYVLLEGRMDVVVGRTLVETVSEGDIVGEMALIDDAPRSASVITTTACRLVGITRERFHALVQGNPSFSTHVMKVLVDRLRRMNRLLVGEQNC